MVMWRGGARQAPIASATATTRPTRLFSCCRLGPGYIRRVRAQASGFTLMELMFVIAIIGILSSIAIPNYITYQIRARATEATIMLETIAHLEQVRILELGSAIACEPSPPELPAREGAAFVHTASWRDLGLAVHGPVHYQYEVRRPGPRAFTAFARGDLDGDGIESTYWLDSSKMEIESERAYE